MGDAAISVKGLKKTYKPTKKTSGKEALTGIDLDIPHGSFFGLLGPNGAGKSTMINILAGLVTKSSGTASVCGFDIDTHEKEAKFSLGVVPQELVLDPFFSVREALENHAGYFGITKKNRRTDDIIDALGLADKADAKARSLSGGMRRRLLVGKALVHNPKVLILDEPTAGVDVELRKQLWEYVRELNKQGTTILLTTHYLEEAEELCDHIAVINHGKLIANDRKEALLNLLDQKQLTATLTEPISEIPKKLSAYDISLIGDDKITINFCTAEITMGDLLQQISKAGLCIKDLSTEEPDLEDVFTHLLSSKS